MPRTQKAQTHMPILSTALHSKSRFAAVAVSLISLAALVACGGGGTEDVVTTDVEWGYAGAGAPENWASLSPDNATCASGMMQSPIDITGYQLGDAPPLSFSFRRGVAEISNDGKRLEAEYEPRNRLGFAERTYELASARWRAPAEHRFDGEELPAELQLVHEQTFGDLAVVSFLYRLGEPDDTLEAFLAAAPASGETASGEGDAFPDLNARIFQPADLGYYKYQGSLTTPPCSEPVDWFVMHEIGTVSQDQVDRLQALIGGIANNRPIQPLNGREINFSGPRVQ